MVQDELGRWPRYARIASRLLAPADRDGCGPELGERKATVEALEGALRARARRRIQRRWTFAVAAALALAGGLTAIKRTGSPALAIRLDDGTSIAVGREVTAAPEREVGLSLRTGTRLRLGGGGRLAVVELGNRQRMLLQAGRLWARVAPLSSGQRFVVATADAEVEVHGTSFEVTVLPRAQSCRGVTTAIRVFEGVVTVEQPGGRRWRLLPGERWPSDCSSPALDAAASVGSMAPPRAIAAPPPRTRPDSAPRRGTIPVAPRRAASSLPGADAASTLAEQNDLFAAAMKARRRGDLAEARRRLDHLLARYPFGALAESARTERARLPPSPPARADVPERER